MATTKAEIRSGTYFDSVILMHLQRSLSQMPGVRDAGVVMGTQANKEILAQIGLVTPEVWASAADDLVIVVSAEDEGAAAMAVAEVDSLLARRRGSVAEEYLPKSLESAAEMLPEARWVLVSVPGRFAASVSREALRLDRNVFLYSDNVSVEDELALKGLAAKRGLLVMGPDCGTAIVNGFGLGFANRVRKGPIGLVAASGTGLQQVTSRIHQLGGGVTHALGTGGRDLTEAIGAASAHQGLDLFRRDAETQVIVLVSKPPSPPVARGLLEAARLAGKPVVVDFIGYERTAVQGENVYIAKTFDKAAEIAVALCEEPAMQVQRRSHCDEVLGGVDGFGEGQRYLRGLFSGGTLAYEAQLLLQEYVPAVYSNAPLREEQRLGNSLVSQGHTIVDLGEDEFTVGRLHPMMDSDLRIRRMYQEAEDPEVAVLLLDVVLGFGAHPDPAGELAPAISSVRAQARSAGRHLEVVAVVVGTDEDPQDMEFQVQQLRDAGAAVYSSNNAAVRYVGCLVQSLGPAGVVPPSNPVELAALTSPFAAINVGLESFAESLRSQGAAVVHVDWRPPAGGNERLMAILERMKEN